MPWIETNVVKERLAFVRDLASGHWSMTELCERYGVTRLCLLNTPTLLALLPTTDRLSPR